MKPKSGGSALKQLKQSITQAKIHEKLQKVGKKKSKKTQQSQVVQRKEARQELRQLQQKTFANNPFEQRFAKEKHQVLGRKVKGVQGRPGQVRARAEEIRRNTIGIELRTKNRDNVIIDKRIGENDPTMSVEDKMLQRMMKEKSRKANASLFNLEEEELTHMGQSLSASGFGDAGFVQVDRDDDSDKGEIEADMVRYGHFGGFEEKEEKDGKKSRNEILKEIIAKSKQHKRERQMIKEQDMDLQEQVDAELDEIRGLLAPMNEPLPVPETQGKMVVNSDRLRMITGEIERPSEQPVPEKVDDDDYDRFVKELAFDKRAKPTDRIKTEEELALEAKKELEELEAKRLRRMKGIYSDDEQEPTKSKRAPQADDLGDDEYAMHVDKTIKDEEEMPLTYKDGVLVNKAIFMKPKKESDSDESGSEEEGSEESQDDSNEGSDNDSEEGSSSESESENESKSTGNYVRISKPMNDESELEEGSEGNSTDAESENDSSEAESVDSDQRLLEEMATDSEAEEDTPKKKKARVEGKETDTLPFTFECPNNYEEFSTLLGDHNLDDQLTIVKRLKILYNPKLAKENKEKMNRLVVILLKHVMDLSNVQPLDMEAVKGFTELVVELCRQSPHAFAAWCHSRLLFLRDRLNKGLQTPKKKASLFPSAGDLLLFMNLSRIYSVSDMQHPVMTPVTLLLGQYLEQAHVYNERDVFAGLFICRVFYQYVQQSKRYIPEVINFLYTVLVNLLPEQKPISTLQTMRSFKADIQLTSLDSDCAELNFKDIFGEPDFEFSTELKMTLLNEVITLFHQFCKLYAEPTPIIEVFEPVIPILEKISPLNETIKVYNVYQKSIKDALGVLKPLIESARLRRKPLMLQKRKAIPIKTFEPKYQQRYSIDKHYDPDRERARRNKEKAEYKKELKGAIRELRKDAAFLGREKLKTIKEKDAEYKKKMNKIVGDLAQQEGAMRGYEKENKKKKK